MSEKPISPLRRRMIEDMTVRNFVEKTRNDYIRHVRTFTTFSAARRIRPRLRIFAFSSFIRRRPAWVRRASMARLRRGLAMPTVAEFAKYALVQSKTRAAPKRLSCHPVCRLIASLDASRASAHCRNRLRRPPPAPAGVHCSSASPKSAWSSDPILVGSRWQRSTSNPALPNSCS